MGGKSSRSKGQSGEREIATMLTYATGIDVCRNLTQTRGGGDDISCIPGLSIEVKRQETLALPAWWRQCTHQAANVAKTPVLAYRQNRKPWTFIVGSRENVLSQADFLVWLMVHLETHSLSQVSS